jgi:hypothetical protein
MKTFRQIIKWYAIGMAIALLIALLLFINEYYFGNFTICAKTSDIIVICFKSALFFGFSAFSLSQALKD